MSINLPLISNFRRRKAAMCGILPTLALSMVAGCAAPPAAEPYDPYEVRNRKVHAFNLALDKALFRPASNAYGEGVPIPVQRGVANFSSNLDLPADVVNNLLQGKPGPAIQNTFRFAVNSTVGILGLFDVASKIDAPQVKTDFGETLHVWGMGEGAYVELPGFGPSNDRDALGTVVDLVANPTSALFPNLPSGLGTAAKIGSKLGDRHRFSATIDSVLYDSADGYAQARLLFQQNRKFDLGESQNSEDNFLDPYEDPYGQ